MHILFSTYYDTDLNLDLKSVVAAAVVDAAVAAAAVVVFLAASARADDEGHSVDLEVECKPDPDGCTVVCLFQALTANCIYTPGKL